MNTHQINGVALGNGTSDRRSWLLMSTFGLATSTFSVFAHGLMAMSTTGTATLDMIMAGKAPIELSTQATASGALRMNAMLPMVLTTQTVAYGELHTANTIALDFSTHAVATGTLDLSGLYIKPLGSMSTTGVSSGAMALGRMVTMTPNTSGISFMGGKLDGKFALGTLATTGLSRGYMTIGAENSDFAPPERTMSITFEDRTMSF